MPVHKMDKVRALVVDRYLKGEADVSMADDFGVHEKTIGQDRKNNKPFWKSEAVRLLCADLRQDENQREYIAKHLEDRSWTDVDVLHWIDTVEINLRDLLERFENAKELFEK